MERRREKKFTQTIWSAVGTTFHLLYTAHPSVKNSERLTDPVSAEERSGHVRCGQVMYGQVACGQTRFDQAKNDY